MSRYLPLPHFSEALFVGCRQQYTYHEMAIGGHGERAPRSAGMISGLVHACLRFGKVLVNHSQSKRRASCVRLVTAFGNAKHHEGRDRRRLVWPQTRNGRWFAMPEVKTDCAHWQ